MRLRSLLLSLFLLIVCTHLSAEIYNVTAPSLNVRMKADANSAVIGKLTAGQQIEVLSIHGEWARIIYSQQEGFVHTKYISPLSVAPTRPKPSGTSKPFIYQLKIGSYDFTDWAFTSLIIYAICGMVLSFMSKNRKSLEKNKTYSTLSLSVLLLMSLTIILIVYGSFNQYLSIQEFGFWRIVLWIFLFAIIGFGFYGCLYLGLYRWLAYNASYCEYKISAYPVYFVLIAYVLGWISGSSRFHKNIFLIKENLLFQNSIWDFIFTIAAISVIIGFVTQIVFFFIRLKDHLIYLCITIPVYIVSYIAVVLSSPILAPCMLIIRYLPPAFEGAQHDSRINREIIDRERRCFNCKFNDRNICWQTRNSIYEKCDNHKYIYEH